MINFTTVSLLGLVLRWSVSLFPYSGANTPPIYGDYEAQRHWQEICINLPVHDWYVNTTDNDLQYWGLDYPPLTAYHSYICGFVAKIINPDYVALHSSRGFESYSHKIFMRYSVLMVDLFIFFPSAYIFSKCLNKYTVSSREGYHSSLVTYSSLILYPGLYLIDYGHFQYNNVSLGLFIFALAAILKNRDCIGAIFFSLSLNYKQMELYHALPFFFFLLGKHFQNNSATQFIFNIFKIGFCVLSVFLVCWAPFLNNLDLSLKVLKRIFPVSRGLFEDKVANFWCSISIITKLKNSFSSNTMALICLVVTSLLLLPSCVHLFANPSHNIFIYCLINCSFIFFLFSFHVHEKSILLVAIPMCLAYSKEPTIVKWFFTISTISMLPLLSRDGLLVPTLFLALLTSCNPAISKNVSKYSLSKHKLCSPFIKLSLILLALLSILSFTFPPPKKYPDLYPVLISLYVFCHFFIFCLYFHYCQYKESVNNVKAKNKLY